MELLIFWFGLSILAGVIASNRGRSGIGFFILALLLSPLIGIIAALVVREDISTTSVRNEQQQLTSGTSKKCPYCAELVKAEATLCRFCGKEFTTQDITRATNKIYQEEEEKKEEASLNGRFLALFLFIAVIFIAFMANR